MQTAPPSRIMLGGAVLNPDSAIPRQLSVCGGRDKVRRAEATEAALPVDLSELLLLARRMLKPAVHSGMPRGQVLLFVRLSRPANDATGDFQIPTGGCWKWGCRSRSRAVSPTRFRLNCRRSATA